MNLTLNEKINGLQKGQMLIISQGNGITCHVERSTKNRTLRYVRTYANGSFEVYKTVNF